MGEYSHHGHLASGINQGAPIYYTCSSGSDPKAPASYPPAHREARGSGGSVAPDEKEELPCVTGQGTPCVTGSAPRHLTENTPTCFHKERGWKKSHLLPGREIPSRMGTAQLSHPKLCLSTSSSPPRTELIALGPHVPFHPLCSYFLSPTTPQALC